MTKQEEIRKGIATTIPPLDCSFCVHFGYCEWEGEGLCLARYELADSIRWYLHSQDVMLKVKCPDCVWSQFGDEAVGMSPCLECNSTGYIYEPLITV